MTMRPPRFLPGLLTGCLLTYIILILKNVHDSEPVSRREREGQGTARESYTTTIPSHKQPVTVTVATDPRGSHLKISCWIMTSPGNLESRARFIQKTWASRCDKVVFISSETNSSFPTVGVPAHEGRKYLTEKTLGGFKYVHDHHLNDCDWFFKADDDTYAIIENLRHFLADFDPNEPIYFGHHFKPLVKQGYSSGGSGLVVSREALRRFGREGHKAKTCRQTGTAGDAAFGQCMQNIGVILGNSTDSRGRSRFHCYRPRTHASGVYPDWYKKYDANGARGGLSSMSDYPISFHYIRGVEQLGLEYLLYGAHVKGG